MPDASELWIGIPAAAILIALLAQAWFSRLHTALIQARRTRLAQLPGTPAGALRGAEELLDYSGPFEVAAHLTTTVAEAVTYAAAAALGLAVAARANPSLRFRDLLPVAAPAVMVSLLLAVLAVLVLGEALPKSLAARHPEEILLRRAGFMRIYSAAMAPVLSVVRWLGQRLAGVFGLRLDQATRAARSEEEIKIIVGGSAEEGVIEREEKEMIESIFDFTETSARQVMVPRVDVNALEASESLEHAVGVIVETGHSRLPLYETTLDQVVGVVYAKDVLRELLTGNHQRAVREIARDPFFVPESKKLDELLAAFRQHRTQIAIVVDEFGGTSGIVTLEDVIEEIVGEIQDEYDVEEPPVLPVDERTWIVDAHLPIDEVNECLELDLPPGDYDSLGGLVYDLFGRPPSPGEQAEHSGARFVIEETEGPRILKVRVVKLEPETGPAENGGES